MGGLLWLAIVGVVFAVIGAFYYLRVIKVMYFDEPVGDERRRSSGGCASRALARERLALLVLGIFWNALIDLCARVLG